MRDQNKRIRHFSIAFKKEKIKLLDEGKITVKHLSELYAVTRSAIYKWKRLHSKLPWTERVVIEKISEAEKSKELMHKVSELERALTRKDLELDYWKTLVSQANALYDTDIEKKLSRSVVTNI